MENIQKNHKNPDHNISTCLECCSTEQTGHSDLANASGQQFTQIYSIKPRRLLDLLNLEETALFRRGIEVYDECMRTIQSIR